jgi:transcriptional regulator with XRE-family HTH domain
VFYDIFAELCKRNDISPSRAALEIGLSKSSVSSWKNSGIRPRYESLKKISDYFGVSTDSLMTKEAEAETPVYDGRLAFYGELKDHLTQDDIDDIEAIMRAKALRNIERALDDDDGEGKKRS